jgi:hypothetical protein
MRFSLLACAALAIVSAPAMGLNYVESVSGDLSNNHASPTPLALTLGANTVGGRMGSNGVSVDPDIFSFTVSPGRSVNAIDLVTFAPVGSANGGSFFAISSGTSISSNDATQHLSNLLVNATGPLLPALATPSFGGPGIAGPLGPGTYTVWFQELATQVDYSFRINVVPEPATFALAGSALLLTLARRQSVR